MMKNPAASMMKTSDIEAGGGQLYPNMVENPQMRWGFIRKVYAIVCIQFLITIAFSVFIFLCPPLKSFIISYPLGISLILVVFVFVIAISCTMTCWARSHPWNYIMMFLFTFGIAFLVGCLCALKRGEIVLMAAAMTAVVTVALTLFTFWAAKKGYDFSFLAPFLLCALIILLAFGIIKILFPLGNIMNLVYACLGALVFSGFIIYDTDNLIKRFDYDQYLEAACSLYIDILNLFSFLLAILEGSSD